MNIIFLFPPLPTPEEPVPWIAVAISAGVAIYLIILCIKLYFLTRREK